MPLKKEYQIVSSSDGLNFQKWFIDAQVDGWTPLPETFQVNANNVFSCMFVKENTNNTVVMKNDPTAPMHHSTCQCAQCL